MCHYLKRYKSKHVIRKMDRQVKILVNRKILCGSILPRKASKDGNKCPICGSIEKPKNTWQLVSPLPDSKGRITITVMGSFECKNGHKWKGVVSKIKVGGSEVEVESSSGKKMSLPPTKEKEERNDYIIVDIDDEEGDNESI
jgi:hypothetical protein